ncbi:MAG: carbon-nitrogen hydrolase [Anaerolineae bacterium]|nr:MAG: carbon-nitrogen hydrolase [Anaerolineae bacterium]
MIRLAVAQIDTVLGDVEANLEKHMARIDEAVQAKADLVVFPELSLTGYALQDLTAAVARRPMADDPIFQTLLQASQRTDLLVGFVEQDERHRIYNSAAYLSQGEILSVHRKVYLPTYGLFDESRFFAWGDSIRAFDTRFGRLGVLICEDFWHASPPYLLWLDGADVLLFISASPGRGLDTEQALESARWVEHVAQAYASLFTTFVTNVGRVGFEDGLGFWGGSVVFNPHGERVARGPYHEESLFIAELDLHQLNRARTRLPLLRDERTELVQRELVRIRRSRVLGGRGPREHSE